MAHIFISFATPGRAIADEVSEWLRVAGHEPFLDHDLRDGVSAGEDWEKRLCRELSDVDAVIGVVTSSCLASNWCSAELGIASARGCRLIPLRAETGVVHPLMMPMSTAVNDLPVRHLQGGHRPSLWSTGTTRAEDQ